MVVFFLGRPFEETEEEACVCINHIYRCGYRRFRGEGESGIYIGVWTWHDRPTVVDAVIITLGMPDAPVAAHAAAETGLVR